MGASRRTSSRFSNPAEQSADPVAPASTLSRRDLLRGLGAATAGMLTPTLAACGDDAASDSGATGDAGTPTPDTGLPGDTGNSGGDILPGPAPSLQPVRGDGSHPYDYIDTIVIVQMENRSFDHYFGSLSLLEGRAVNGLTAEHHNLTGSGRRIDPAHLQNTWRIDPDPGHGHGSCLDQWANGQNSGFVTDWEALLSPEDYETKLGWSMGYHVRGDLPAYYGLADAFTLCDRWHCSLLGPTWPNRFYSHAATSGGNWSNRNALTDRTIHSIARAAGLSVGLYRTSIIHFMHTLIDAEGVYDDHPIEDFAVDAAAGRLPNICVVEPHYGMNDDHPPHDLRLGQSFVAGVYEALRTSPQFNRSLMLVFYDEHGGFYDHVGPPTAEGDERAAEGFNQLGFRIPGLIVSPLARRGATFSGLLEHSSVPALISRVFGLEHVNLRAELAPDFADAFDLELTLDSRRPEPPALPPIELPEEKIRLALNEPFGQPELLEFCQRRLGITIGGVGHEMGRLERYWTQLERLRVARVL
jgi:phospholipase C